MRKISILLLIFLVLLSCNNNDDNDNSIRIESFHFFENATIITETFDGATFALIQTGDNLVFDYGVFTDLSKDIADDESSSSLIFEISPMLDSFEFSNQELEEMNCYFSTSGSEFTITKKVNQGSIVGNKMDNGIWNIEINVTLEGGGIEVNGIFNLMQRN